MPLTIPTLDDRKYQDLVNEALARIPVHNPEWTNFNESDPGITLVELFAFLTENLLYRSNQIPERNRLKFLSLLGIPLQPASSASGIVTFSNDRGPLQTFTLERGVEVRAGQVPYRTERGLDVLPIEAQVFYKRALDNPDQRLKDYYSQLYASYITPPALPNLEPLLYETVQLTSLDTSGIDLSKTLDTSLWIALLARVADKPYADNVKAARKAIVGKTLSLGVVPILQSATRQLLPGGQANPQDVTLLQYQIPKPPPGGSLSTNPAERVPRYQPLITSAQKDILAEPGIVEITLPTDEQELILWNNLDPLETGVGDFPPALEDTTLNERLITWLRISSPTSTRGGSSDSPASIHIQFLWIGINAASVTQLTSVTNELLPPGTGEPDQVVTLSKTPVVPGSVQLTVIPGTTNAPEQWTEIDDLLNAGPEITTTNMRQPPGTATPSNPLTKVFAIDSEAGQLRFGDGSTHGTRPPFAAIMRVNYAYSVGRAGNVGPNSINTGPTLPAGMKVSNPISTWGGADAESVSDGEKQISRYLQHRDRLVNASDFETITRRTPGVDIGRVEVLPAFNPELPQNEPGDAPGAVTLMVIPQHDPDHPNAPVPDRLFLDTICNYIDQRRLVTTEVFLRGPTYKGIWISIGIRVVPGISPSQGREAVKNALLQFLSPLPRAQNGSQTGPATQPTTSQNPGESNGWPLRKPVVTHELLTIASRVQEVLLVNDVLIAEGTKPSNLIIDMNGLELPQVLGISVVIGDPVDLDQLRGQQSAPQAPPAFLPVPVIPEECA